MSNYVFNNTENISVSSSLSNFLNIHPKTIHPGDSTDVIPSQNISLKNLKNLANKNFYSPDIDSLENSPISVDSFNNTSFMSVEVYSRRDSGTTSTSAKGDIFIRPRYGSGKYNLTWWRTPQSISDLIGTLKVAGPWHDLPGVGSRSPIQYFESLPPFNSSGFIYEPYIYNRGTATWSGFKIEILNLNNPNATNSQKNYLRATCRRDGSNIKWCTDKNNGTYKDPVTNLTHIEIKNWDSSVGSSTGTTYYNVKVPPGGQVILRHQIFFQSPTCTVCNRPGRVIGNLPKDGYLYPLTFKITPFLLNSDGLPEDEITEISWPGPTTVDQTDIPSYFSEGVIISTGNYLPPTPSTPSENKGYIEIVMPRPLPSPPGGFDPVNATKEYVKTILSIPQRIKSPVYGFKGVDDSNPNVVGGPEPTDYVVSYRLTDIETGQSIFFIARPGKVSGDKNAGGYCSWLPNLNLSTEDTYLKIFTNKQTFKPTTETSISNPSYVTDPVELFYPGDDFTYTWIDSDSPFW